MWLLRWGWGCRGLVIWDGMGLLGFFGDGWGRWGRCLIDDCEGFVEGGVGVWEGCGESDLL